MREPLHLRRRYRAMAAHVGLVLALVGLCMLAPLLATPAWPLAGREIAAFLVPAAGLGIGGVVVWRLLRAPDVTLTLQEGGVIVVVGWVLTCLAGAVPFLWLGLLDFTQAVFESVSGWTTTGLSVVDVTQVSPTILLWRSTMQLAGGAGLAILMLAAVAGPGGAPLAVAEGRSDHLVPNVRASALLVVRIYVGYVLFGIVALRAVGMDWFDAVNHSFCAFSTGGFSTRADSLGHWDAAAVEGVMIVLMILGNASFVTSWCLLRGRFAAVARNGEVRLAALLIPCVALPVCLLTCVPLYASFGKAVRVALFETVSALTTTGYSTVPYTDWNGFGILCLVVLMLVGASSCSTGGAIKQVRVYLLLRALARELLRPLRPRTAVVDESIWVGEERVPLPDPQVRLAGLFVFLYVATWLVGSAVLAALGCRLQDALFEFASALGTVGLSIGVTGPGTSAGILWTETVGMFLGRLELFVVFTSIAKVALDVGRMSARSGERS